MLICSPVRGLRATRAGRLRTSKPPKPTIWTFSPAARVSVMTSVTAAIAFSASFLVKPVFLTMAAVNSALFTMNYLL